MIRPPSSSYDAAFLVRQRRPILTLLDERDKFLTAPDRSPSGPAAVGDGAWLAPVLEPPTDDQATASQHQPDDT